MIFIQLTQFSESIETRQLVATALRAVFLPGQTGHKARGYSVCLPAFSGRDLGQNSAQLVKIDRFTEIKIEAGLSPALDVLSRSKSTERHGCYRPFALRMSHNVIAVAVRQGDVAQNDVELFRFDGIQRVLRAIGQRNFMAEMREKTRQRLQRIAVIFDYQNTQAFAGTV